MAWFPFVFGDELEAVSRQLRGMRQDLLAIRNNDVFLLQSRIINNKTVKNYKQQKNAMPLQKLKTNLVLIMQRQGLIQLVRFSRARQSCILVVDARNGTGLRETPERAWALPYDVHELNCARQNKCVQS